MCSIDAAKEVLGLGRSLGYPDEQTVEAYGENPSATLSRLRQEAQQKAQPTRTFQTPAAATQEIELLKGKAWLAFDPKKWKEAKSSEPPIFMQVLIPG